MTSTRQPSSAARLAAVSPAMPPPTTTRSASTLIACDPSSPARAASAAASDSRSPDQLANLGQGRCRHIEGVAHELLHLFPGAADERQVEPLRFRAEVRIRQHFL